VLVAHVTARIISEATIGRVHAQAPLEPLIPVYVFMILSGFVIFSLLHRQQESYGVFVLRRFFRLAPLFLVVLLVSSQLVSFELRTLDHLFWRNPHIYDAIKIHRETLADFWPHFWSHFLLLHGLVPETLLPDGNFTFLSQGWSISLEWQFYLLAPLLYLSDHATALCGAWPVGRADGNAGRPQLSQCGFPAQPVRIFRAGHRFFLCLSNTRMVRAHPCAPA